jgi:hypothetical protein
MLKETGVQTPVYRPIELRNWYTPWQYVDFPLPGAPMINWPKGIIYLLAIYLIVKQSKFNILDLTRKKNVGRKQETMVGKKCTSS